MPERRFFGIFSNLDTLYNSLHFKKVWTHFRTPDNLDSLETFGHVLLFFVLSLTNLENRLCLQQPESLLFSGSKIRWWPEFQKETISVSQVIQFSNLEVRWKVSINQCMYLLISFPCNIQLKGDHLVRLPQRLSLGQRMVIFAKMLVPTSQLPN